MDSDNPQAAVSRGSETSQTPRRRFWLAGPFGVLVVVTVIVSVGLAFLYWRHEAGGPSSAETDIVYGSAPENRLAEQGAVADPELRPEYANNSGSPVAEIAERDVVKPTIPAGCRNGETFDVHGSGTKAGTARWFRIGDVFSVAGGEGGSVSLSIAGLKDRGLLLRTTREASPCPELREPGTDKPQSKTRTISPSPDGRFRVEHQGINVETEDSVIVQRGRYVIDVAAPECLRIELLKDIPEYLGE